MKNGGYKNDIRFNDKNNSSRTAQLSLSNNFEFFKMIKSIVLCVATLFVVTFA